MNTSKGQVYSEELRGQLSEALPNAVGIFAQALYGNDPDGEKKLFKAMERGEVRMEELVKVIDYMKTLSREDLIKMMLDSPAKKLTAMRTAWSRLLTEINSSFMLDVFTAAFDTMADEIKKATSWMKENKEEIKLWVNRVKHLVGALWDLKEVLLALYVTNKLIAASGVATGLWSFLTRIPVLPPAPLSVRIINMLKSGLRMAARAWPVLAGAFIWDLIETLQGKDTLLSTWSDSNNPFVAWAARIPILLGAAVANLGIGALLGKDWLSALLFGDEQDMTVVEDAMSLWATDMKTTIKKYGLEPLFTFLQVELKKLMLVGSALKRAASLDFDGAKAAIAEFGALSIEQSGRLGVPQTQLQMPVSTTSFSTSNPSMLLPRQQTPTTQTFSLVINAEGTPDAIKSVATQAFADMMSSSILGVSANYQGGK